MKALIKKLFKPEEKTQYTEIIVIIGLPRSGTTLAAAVFDAHPKTTVCYEPWNSNQPNPPDAKLSLSEIATLCEASIKKGATTFVIKETGIRPEAMKWISDFISHNEEHYPVKVIWTVRYYRHTYLSLMEKGREWWGNKNLKVARKTYNRWVFNARNSTKKLADIYNDHPGLIYSYERLIEEKESLIEKIMKEIGLGYHRNQGDHSSHISTRPIQGDLNVKKTLAPISDDFLRKRDEEWESHRATIDLYENNTARESLDRFSKIIYDSKILTGHQPVISQAGLDINNDIKEEYE